VTALRTDERMSRGCADGVADLEKGGERIGSLLSGRPARQAGGPAAVPR
jgi:hypothetical protein